MNKEEYIDHLGKFTVEVNPDTIMDKTTEVLIVAEKGGSYWSFSVWLDRGESVNDSDAVKDEFEFSQPDSYTTYIHNFKSPVMDAPHGTLVVSPKVHNVLYSYAVSCEGSNGREWYLFRDYQGKPLAVSDAAFIEHLQGFSYVFPSPDEVGIKEW